MEHVIAPDDRYLPPPLDVHVKAGEQVEVDDETAASLKAQGWETARQAAARRREERKAREAAPPTEEPPPEVEDEGLPPAPDTSTAGPPADIEE